MFDSLTTFFSYQFVNLQVFASWFIGGFKVVVSHCCWTRCPQISVRSYPRSKTGYVRIKTRHRSECSKPPVLKLNLHGFLGTQIPRIEPWNLLFKVIVHFLPWDSPPSDPAHLGRYVWFTLSKHLNIIMQIQGNWPWFSWGQNLWKVSAFWKVWSRVTLPWNEISKFVCPWKSMFGRWKNFLGAISAYLVQVWAS